MVPDARQKYLYPKTEGHIAAQYVDAHGPSMVYLLANTQCL